MASAISELRAAPFPGTRRAARTETPGRPCVAGRIRQQGGAAGVRAVQPNDRRTLSAPRRAEPEGGCVDVEASDEQLLERFARGDQSAAREIVARHARRVLALATRMLNDAAEAEDVVQEAMLRVWRIAPDWEAGKAQFSTWLHRVALNLCYDRLRKRRTVDLDSAPEPEDPTPSAQARMEEREGGGALRAALQTLPERQRAAILLRHFEERSNPEIAEALSVSVEAVESLLARARRALKAALEGRRDELWDD